MKIFKTPLGNLGAWLCDHFQPRRCTSAEIASTRQYCALMVDVLTGLCTFYGRDSKGAKILLHHNVEDLVLVNEAGDVVGQSRKERLGKKRRKT